MGPPSVVLVGGPTASKPRANKAVALFCGGMALVKAGHAAIEITSPIS